MALEQMEGFELAGRQVSVCFFFFFSPNILTNTLQLRVNTVHDKGTGRYTVQDSLEDTGGLFPVLFLLPYHNVLSTGGNLNAASRQALMQKLARVDSAPVREETKCVNSYFLKVDTDLSYSNRPNIPDNMTSRSVVLKNMFDPEQYVNTCCWQTNLTFFTGSRVGIGTKNSRKM